MGGRAVFLGIDFLQFAPVVGPIDKYVCCARIESERAALGKRAPTEIGIEADCREPLSAPGLAAVEFIGEAGVRDLADVVEVPQLHRVHLQRKDVIADAFLQQILLRPDEYDVIATLNLNGDYISDALAAQVGGIGIAPGANLSDTVAMFEATHGTAPKYAGQDYVNPGSLILSAEMMLRHLGWVEAADAIIRAVEKTIAAKVVTYDFARLMQGATQVPCSKFGEALISNMG